jgi:hypothetical protein
MEGGREGNNISFVVRNCLLKIYIRPNERMYNYFTKRTFALLGIHLLFRTIYCICHLIVITL